MKSKLSLTIVLVTHNRCQLLTKVVDSVCEAMGHAPDVQVEWRICLNGSDLDTSKYLQSQKSRLMPGRIQELTQSVTPAEARNHILNDIQSSWVLFLDDDVKLPLNFFSEFAHLVQEDPDVGLWGGPNLTCSESTSTQKLIGWYLQNKTVVGPVANRYKIMSDSSQSKGNQFNLMLCNLFVRTECLQKTTLFQTHFKTAEENELVYQLQKQNCQMKTSEHLKVWHERRPHLTGFLKQIFYYGYGRGQLLKIVSPHRQLLFLLAPLVVLSLMYLLYHSAALALALWMLWTLIVVGQGVWQFKRIQKSTFYIPSLIWVMYSCGLARGLLDPAQRKLS